MSNIASGAILTRIREVLLDGAGDLRTISATRFEGDLPEGLSESAQMMRGAVKARVEASVSSIERHPQSPPSNGSVMLYVVGVEVRAVRTVLRIEQLVDADRDTLRALCIEDADIIRQALEYPRNLTATTAGTATGIVSGLLRYAGSETRTSRGIDQGTQILSTIHSFTGSVKVTPETAAA